MFSIVTDRYNNDTWNDSCHYREKKQLECIYAPPVKLSLNIQVNSLVFVIEMNNSTNEIMGIGLIRNKLVTDRVYKVQKDTNHNRYIYIGKHHISRDLIYKYNPLLVSILDKILFKGYTHSKRGTGLKKIPEKIITNMDICDGINIKTEIINVFINHFPNTIVKHQQHR